MTHHNHKPRINIVINYTLLTEHTRKKKKKNRMYVNHHQERLTLQLQHTWATLQLSVPAQDSATGGRWSSPRARYRDNYFNNRCSIHHTHQLSLYRITKREDRCTYKREHTKSQRHREAKQNITRNIIIIAKHHHHRETSWTQSHGTIRPHGSYRRRQTLSKEKLYSSYDVLRCRKAERLSLEHTIP